MTTPTPYTWYDAMDEVAGRAAHRSASPWDALSLVSLPPGPDRASLLPGDVDTEVVLGDGPKAARFSSPLVLTDDSRGILSPQGRLALLRTAAKRGCGLRLSDADPDMLELARELGVTLWSVVGPTRSSTSVKAMRGASVVELELMDTGHDGGLATSVDSRSEEGSPDAVVTVLRSVSGGAPIIVNLGPTADRGLLRWAVLSGADAIAVRARSRSSAAHPMLTGPDPVSAVAATVRAIARTSPPEDRPAPRVVAYGGFKDGIEAVKALALGADLVVTGTAPRVAMGCQLGGECGPGECPKGATDWKELADALTGYLDRVEDQMRLVLAHTGCAAVGEASPSHLEARTYDVAATTGTSLAGYGEPLPMWLH